MWECKINKPSLHQVVIGQGDLSQLTKLAARQRMESFKDQTDISLSAGWVLEAGSWCFLMKVET